MFAIDDVIKGIKEFPVKKFLLKKTTSRSVGTNTFFVCACYKRENIAEITDNILGQLPLPIAPVTAET